jgi:hypothetical protein
VVPAGLTFILCRHPQERQLPVTAKLSRKFYEKFGDELANELVEWFNQVDATYRSDLRELNELNFARFDAKLAQRLAELDARWEQRTGSLKAELIKWMFVFWAGTTLTVLGTTIALLKL